MAPPKKKTSYATTFQMHSAISIMLHIMLSYKNRLMINVYHDLPCYFYNPLNYKGIQNFDKISFKG
jgi:hypothetical protein